MMRTVCCLAFAVCVPVAVDGHAGARLCALVEDLGLALARRDSSLRSCTVIWRVGVAVLHTLADLAGAPARSDLIEARVYASCIGLVKLACRLLYLLAAGPAIFLNG